MDGPPLIREGLKRVIEQQPGFEWCGEAHSSAEALTEIAGHQPDLILTNFELPDCSGLQFLKNVHALYPALPILVISFHDDRTHAERALRAGALGYILLNSEPNEVIDGIRTVLHGRHYVSQTLMASLLSAISSPSTSQEDPLESLSDREMEVFELTGKGKRPQKIAEMLNISTKTVHAHRAKAREKLGLHDSSQFMRFAACWTANRMDAVG